MRSGPLLFFDFDMVNGDELEISEPTTFEYWKSIVDMVADSEHEMSFDGSGLTRWGVLATLPYWPELKIHHLLDPMHIDGNVGKALIKHFYGEKDTNFREACEELERHPDMWITVDPHTRREHRPNAPWVLSVGERREFRQRIGQMRFSYRVWCQPL
jgi:hypothetical protein